MTRLAIVLAVFTVACVPRPTAVPTATGADDADGERGTFVFVGTSAGELVVFKVASGGRLALQGRTSLGRGVTAVATDASGRFVHAATEGGEVVALALRGKKNAPSIVGRAATRGSGPVGLAAHRTGKYAFAARGGGVGVIAVDPEGGLSAPEIFDTGAGARAVAVHPKQEGVLVVNAGAHTITQFGFAVGTGILTPRPEPQLVLGAKIAPRQLAFHPTGRRAYLLAEDGTIYEIGRAHV